MKSMLKFFAASSLFVATLASADAPKQLATRVELYEVTKADFVEIGQLAGGPMRTKLLEMLKEDKASLLSVSESKSRSGEIAKVESIEPVHYPDHIGADGKVVYADTQVGSRMEVEGTIGGNDFVIDIRVDFLSRAKTGQSETLRDDDGRIYERPFFHSLSANTAITIYDGYTMNLFIQRSADPTKLVIGMIKANIVDSTGRPIRGQE